MIIRCSVCGNCAVSDKSGEIILCKVCGSSALWEADDICIDEKEQICEECGNPLSPKAGERYKCAVCGFEGISPATLENAAYLSDENAAENFDRSNNILPLHRPDKKEETAFIKAREDYKRSVFSERNDDRSGDSSSIEGRQSDNKKTSVGKEIGVHVNAADAKPKNDDNIHSSPKDEKGNGGNKIVAFATDIYACNKNTNERAKYADTGFDKIFIVPAPLGKARFSDPDISFSMKGRDKKDVRFDIPVIDILNSDIAAAFNAIPYYISESGISLKENFKIFEAESSEKLTGISILPYCIHDDLILADELGCNFVEVNFADVLPPGTEKADAAKCITSARGIISRRGLKLYLIIKIGAFTSADVIKALCLGADALSANEDGFSEDFKSELKEYCRLCAHGKITEFSRSDLKFK